MIGLDTNVLIRYLTKDDQSQWQQAQQIIESGQQCFIANIVLCEIVWVLKGEAYQYTKGDIIKTLEAMLSCESFEARKSFSFLSSFATDKKRNRRFFRLSNRCGRYSIRSITHHYF